jgi:hypothetical protein
MAVGRASTFLTVGGRTTSLESIAVHHTGNHGIRSLASSITRLGIVRYAIPEDGSRAGELLPSGIVQLPSFTNDDTSRPTVQMPPLAGHRERPASIDEAFDKAFDEAFDPFDPDFDGDTVPGSEPV